MLIQIPTRIPPLLGLPHRETIPQIPKAVAPRRVPDVLKVLGPQRLEHVEEVDPAARVQRDDWPFLPAHLEPTAARRRPCRPRHKRGDVLVVVVDGLRMWREGADVFYLSLFEEPRDVPCDVLAEGEDGAVAYGGVGAEECCWCGLSATDQVPCQQDDLLK